MTNQTTLDYDDCDYKTGVRVERNGFDDDSGMRIWDTIVPMPNGTTKYLRSTGYTVAEAIGYGNGFLSCWIAQNGESQ